MCSRGPTTQPGMRKFIDFMLGKEFQTALPDNMYVYPIDSSVALPESWAAYAKTAAKPFTMPADEIADNLGPWLRDWRDVTSQ